MTNTQIARQVFGTAKAEYKDGVWGRAARDMMALTRTAVQHAATQARMETYAANDDIIKGYQIVATLDGRTSPECQLRDGEIYPNDGGNHPAPPFHPNCRSTTIPVLDDAFAALSKDETRAARDADGTVVQVPADMKYYDWLKTQPKEFQDEVLGKKRGRLLREGGLTAEQFRKLQLGKNFKQRTLDEMRALDSSAFERAGIPASSGGISGGLDPNSEEANTFATQYYESIRNRTSDSDVRNITKNTGLPKSVVSDVKHHVFLDKSHNLSNGEIGGFDPNPEMAWAWQRLDTGKGIREADITLLKHEFRESVFMNKYGYDYHRAHIEANKFFNWESEIKKSKIGG